MAYLPLSLVLVPVGSTPVSYKGVFSCRTVHRRNHPQVSWNYGDKYPLPRQRDKQPTGYRRYCLRTCQSHDDLRRKLKQNDSIIEVTRIKWHLKFRRTCSLDTRKLLLLLLLLFICTRTSWSTFFQDSTSKIKLADLTDNEVMRDSCSVSDSLLRSAIRESTEFQLIIDITRMAVANVVRVKLLGEI